MAIVYHPKPTDVSNMVVFISANKYHPLVYTTQVNGVLSLHWLASSEVISKYSSPSCF